MWNAETRRCAAKVRSKLRRYPTDLTDEEWLVIAPLLPQPREKGRPRKTDLREVVNAIRYLVRTGCGWEMLPSDFPPWQTVYYYLRRWQAEGVWRNVHHALVLADRERCGREASPSAAILDSQSVRTADQKGVARATMRARRSPGASATS